jgi:hypothetical protein
MGCDLAHRIFKLEVVILDSKLENTSNLDPVDVRLKEEPPLKTDTQEIDWKGSSSSTRLLSEVADQPCSSCERRRALEAERVNDLDLIESFLPSIGMAWKKSNRVIVQEALARILGFMRAAPDPL